MTLSLDSSVVVDLLRGRPAEVRRRFAQAKSAGVEMTISAVVLSELAYGAHKAGTREAKLSDLDRFLSLMPVSPFSADDALTSGRLRAELSPTGRVLDPADLFIAAQALGRGWTVVTSDIRHFGRVQGLPIINWRVSDKPFDIAELIAHLTGRTED